MAGTKNNMRAQCTYILPPGDHNAAASAAGVPLFTNASISGALNAAMAGLMMSGSMSSS